MLTVTQCIYLTPFLTFPTAVQKSRHLTVDNSKREGIAKMSINRNIKSNEADGQATKGNLPAEAETHVVKDHQQKDIIDRGKHANKKRDTICLANRRNSIRKCLNLLLKRSKMENLKKGTSPVKDPSKVKRKRQKRKKLMMRDYQAILNAGKGYLKKYEEEKTFFCNIKRDGSSGELTKDSSYFPFFFNLFVKGSYIGGSCRGGNEKNDYSSRNGYNGPRNGCNGPRNGCNGPRNGCNTPRGKIAFLRGRRTRMLIADYLKILLNNLQNENAISNNFRIIDYAEEREKRERRTSHLFNNCEERDEKKEEYFLMCSNNMDKEKKKNGKGDKSPKERNCITEMSGKKMGNNSTDISTNDELTVVSNSNNEKHNGKAFIKINDFIFTKMVNNFVLEIKSFFFSLIAKMKNEKFIAKLIVHFSDICLMLTPYYVNIIHFIEILSEFANVFPTKWLKCFMHFVKKNKTEFIEKYKQFQNYVIFNDPIKVQSVGARLIGFVKILQKKSNLNKKKQSSHIFFLNILLSECLPMDHLGFCNRQSVKNNINLFFYDSLQCLKNNAHKEAITFNELEFNFQNNVNNFEKVKNFIKGEIDAKLPPKECTVEEGIVSETAQSGTDPDQPSEQPSTQPSEQHSTHKKSHQDGEKQEEKKDTHTSTNASGKNKSEVCGTEGKKRKRGEGSSHEGKGETKKSKHMKYNNLLESLNTTKENYYVYLSYIYLIVFVKFPEMFVNQNNIELEGVHNSFKTFYAHIKNLKKENNINMNAVEGYLYNADFDLLGNTHIYDMLIRDERFLGIFFFNVLMVLTYLKYELGGESKIKESGMRATSGTNAESTARPPKAQPKSAKDETKGEQSGNVKSDLNVSTNDENDGRSKTTVESGTQKGEEIMQEFIKDVVNCLKRFKSTEYFQQLLCTEYSWYLWKKQLSLKLGKETVYPSIEFQTVNRETKEKKEKKDKKDKKEKKEVEIKNNLLSVDKGEDITISPMMNLLRIIEHFEALNRDMKTYYEVNCENCNANMTKNVYKYAKFVPYTPDNNVHEIRNFLLEINKIYLRREAEFWELDESTSITVHKKKENEKKILIEKLIDKLEDYKKKMLIDNDPINEIEESEKSKNNPVFKFRLAKLFILKYIDIYTLVKNCEFSTDCDFLNSLMIQMDKGLEEKRMLLGGEAESKVEEATKEEAKVANQEPRSSAQRAAA
ncbi:conserved Plasmodium protein, unknown function [Plasmodium ovale wallikeri]|uniref:Uncharacterized protein n=2 Tax=Plasmodium ovale TaxID=36330 RepID=A0A1A8YLS1_PLAOA|nr:conserved Plasmodium protein, unknown function [Plasmodium ovale wallikeri]